MTNVFRSHLHGTPVARPTFFEFPQDQNTYFMDQQFMWGEAILIVPVLDEVGIYFHSAFAMWQKNQFYLYTVTHATSPSSNRTHNKIFNSKYDVHV